MLAYFVVGLDWPKALLLGAILSPTDPVFAAGLVGNDRLRHLLNVEATRPCRGRTVCRKRVLTVS